MPFRALVYLYFRQQACPATPAACSQSPRRTVYANPLRQVRLTCLASSLLRKPKVEPVYEALETLLLSKSFVWIFQKSSCLKVSLESRLQNPTITQAGTYSETMGDLREDLHVEIFVAFRKDLDRSTA